MVAGGDTLYPLKRSGNHSRKLIRAESLKARKRFLMFITPVYNQLRPE